MTPNHQAAHLRAVPDPTPETPIERRLRVVEGGIGRAARAVRMLGSTLLITFIVGLVGALIAQASLIENQRALDDQRALIERIEADTESLRHELAVLEAPARVVDEARQLGMIEAPAVTYLHTPTAELDERTIIIAENQLQAG